MQDRSVRWPFDSQTRAWIFASLLALTTFFAYEPAWHGGFIWDDDDYIVKNDLLVAPGGLGRIWFSLDSPSQYFPLVYTTFRIERALWGLNPTGYHIVNILFHIANALLVWRLLVRLKIPGAWLASAIFALHPVQVESVAWITERKNVLMGIFFLSSLYAWAGFVDQQTRRRWLCYGLAIILYVLALLAKTTACTEAAALFLILWLQKKPIDWRRVAQILPFVVLGLAMGLVTLWWERYHQGTRGALFALGALERILIASRAVWFYLGKLIWPGKLTFIYPQWVISPHDFVDYIWPLATVTAATFICWIRRYAGRGIEVGMAFFLATLSPVLGFIMLYTFRYTFVADHYQYLACIGPIALVSAGLARLTDRFKTRRALMLAPTFIVVAVLTMLTWRQSMIYADIETLWRSTISKNPMCWMAYNNLGIVLSEKGGLDQAIVNYRKTLEMRPDYENAHYNLGNALLEKGEVDQAIAHCQIALTTKPNDPEAHVGLANALLIRGSVDEAIAHYEKALALRPYYFAGHYNLSRALLEKGDSDAAIAHSRAALAIQPRHPEANVNLGLALSQAGQTSDAIKAYEAALSVAPQSIFALNNLAWLLATSSDARLRNGDKALTLALHADQISGHHNPLILRTVAAAQAELGQFPQAIEAITQALKLAAAQRDNALSAALQEELSAYQANSPFREPKK